ncbi:MAG: diguanylate cyclase domain-containing protein [Acidithiobacillus sp.]
MGNGPASPLRFQPLRKGCGPRYAQGRGRDGHNLLLRTLLDGYSLFLEDIQGPAGRVFQGFADLLVERLGLPLVMVSTLLPEGKGLQIVALSGRAAAYLRGFDSGDEQQRDGGVLYPACTALRQDAPLRWQIVATTEALPWVERARRFHLGGCLQIPFQGDGGGRWVLSLYCHEHGRLPHFSASLTEQLRKTLCQFLERRSDARELLRLRRYQSAALRVQQELLREKSSESSWQRLVEILVNETPVSSAWVAARKSNSSLLAIRALASRDASHLQTLQGHDLSLDPSRWPQGQSLVGQAWRERRPLGPAPLFSPDDTPVAADPRRHPPPLGSAMVWPISLSENSEPRAVLVVEANHSQWFNEALRNLLAQISESFSLSLEQREYQRRIENLALMDALTRLPNRRYLEQWLEESLARNQHNAHNCLAICMLDLDGFKAVNDQYGHAAGDHLLQEIAARVQQSLRFNDLFSRWGGDEFVLVMEDMPDRRHIEEALHKIRLLIEEPIALDTATVRVGTSMGVCVCAGGSQENAAALLRQADSALYVSKRRKGRRSNAWTFSDELDAAGKGDPAP